VLGGTDGDGFGFVFRGLDIDETTTPGLVKRASGTTVNDVLATATAAVAKQTEDMRRNDRSYGLYDLLRATKKAPLAVKRAVPN
jgi:hypothetical protein